MEPQDLHAFLVAHFEQLQFTHTNDGIEISVPDSILDAVAAWLTDRCLDHDDRFDLFCNYLLRCTEEELTAYMARCFRGERDPKRTMRDYVERLIQEDHSEALIERYRQMQQPDPCDLAKQLQGAA